MTDPEQAGVADPVGEHDPERAEQYAESVPVDPTPEEMARYAELSGEGDGVAALAEPADPAG